MNYKLLCMLMLTSNFSKNYAIKDVVAYFIQTKTSC